MTRTAVIVQARMTSTRLPGKVLLPLGGTTVLDQVLARCAAIPGVHTVLCAVPDGQQHDPVAAEAQACGVPVFRGSEDDVLDRYARAAQSVSADVVMRVTSDCPLIDPAICGQVLDLVRAGVADYACNNMPRSFPHGLDCEAFPAFLLQRAAELATAASEREHVTPWLRSNTGLRRVSLVGPGEPLAGMRITLDTADDFHHITRIFKSLHLSHDTPDVDRLTRLVLAGRMGGHDFSILDKLAALPISSSGRSEGR